MGLLEWVSLKHPALVQRLILLSSGAAVEASRMAEKYSGCQVLQKPFKTADLLAAIETTLRQVHSTPIQR